VSAAEDLSDVKFEYQFKDRDFNKLKEIVYARTGITLGEEKRQLVYSRFAKRIRKLNLQNFSEYIEYFEKNEESEVTDFINAITTNFTSFFREPHHFEFLKNFIAEREMASRYCRIWSAGCSSGEEPYSIAMTVLDSIANPDAWDIKILCTDIDTSVLRKAEQGVYDAARVEGVLTAKRPDIKQAMSHAADEEIDHLVWCEQRLKELGSHTSLLNPLFYAGSFAIGATAGAISDKISLGFVAATEDQVCEHLRSHLDSLPNDDEKSRAILEQMLEDEAAHSTAAIEAGGAVFPKPIKKAMTLVSKVMTRTTYYV